MKGRIFASISRAENVAALRAGQVPYRIFTLDEAAAYIRDARPLPLLPLCGGVPPDIPWPYLERAVMRSSVRDPSSEETS